MIDVERDFSRMRDYLVGRMSDDDLLAFEDRLIRDPELVRELEVSSKLHAGLDDLRRSGALGQSTRSYRRRWAIPFGLAAALAGIALVLWVLRPGSGPVRALTASPALVAAADANRPIAAQFSFIETRGHATPALDLPANGFIELRVMPSRRSPALRYRMTLERRGATGLASLGVLTGLAAGADGYVRSYVEASRLHPGNYELRVEAGDGTDPVVDTFAFDLRSVRHP